jgi:APA family basic amino acid/polyamine antiporter
MGILGAAGVVFFAFIGFDAVSTAAQEAKNPKRDMPIGISARSPSARCSTSSSPGCLSGLAPSSSSGSALAAKRRSPRHHDLHAGYGWLSNFVTVAILAGFLVGHPGHAAGSVPRVLLDEPRRPGAGRLLEVHPVYKTPYKSNWLFFVFTAIFAAFFPTTSW